VTSKYSCEHPIGASIPNFCSKAEHGGSQWPDQTIAEVIKYGTKDIVEIVLPAWIAHSFPKEIQIIAHHELQSLITNLPSQKT
jgi:hypothetical protein